MAHASSRLSVLSAEQVEAFRTYGHVRVKEAMPPRLALRMQDEIWAELAREHDILRTQPDTWVQPRTMPAGAKRSPLNRELIGPRFRGVIDDLLGPGRWREPGTWGGFVLKFPAPPDVTWTVPDDSWHWDGGPGPGLLIFSFFSRVAPGGGGTCLLSGSPRLIAEFYQSLSPAERALRHKVHRKKFLSSDPWLAALSGRVPMPAADRIDAFMARPTEVRGVACQVVELTGEPGDVVFCSPMMLHALAPNCSPVPRFLRVKFFYPATPPPDGQRSSDQRPR